MATKSLGRLAPTVEEWSYLLFYVAATKFPNELNTRFEQRSAIRCGPTNSATKFCTTFLCVDTPSATLTGQMAGPFRQQCEPTYFMGAGAGSTRLRNDSPSKGVHGSPDGQCDSFGTLFHDPPTSDNRHRIRLRCGQQRRSIPYWRLIPKASQPIMGDLPKDEVSAVSPFAGVDFYTPAFLDALKRFVLWRGYLPALIRSNNETNYGGAG
ncbi:hypothetical protein EVAR_89336_1 [Eumeta japonica]|uniref:Uncharacterized protein n=1 Tax=Eumeta variegata TaxID=151549 RepID=A0A4C1Y3A4_EUMVA|nr:hypothetical protein EVAR_89336_1 [Eumeta japonica]